MVVKDSCHEAIINMLRTKASEVRGDGIIGIDLDATGGATASVIHYDA